MKNTKTKINTCKILLAGEKHVEMNKQIRRFGIDFDILVESENIFDNDVN